MCCGLVVLLCDTVESAVFHCAGGDVPCLINAINQSNINGESNTIRLEAGTYSLTEVDNLVHPPSMLTVSQ